MDAAMNVRVGAKTQQFEKAMKRMSYKVKKFGGQVKKMGASMTRNFTMPLAFAGAASVKLALDFEKSMTKIQTLVGVSAKDVGELKKEVLDLAGKTAQAPVALAEGLYFLTSAGLTTEGAMKALEQVSKGAASGLGEQADLALVAAAAQNAYGEGTLDASAALDGFGQMVKTGMFDAAELSKVLGVQLGLASNLGVKFDDVGAFISTYTRTTGDATGASVGFGAVMMSFAKIAPVQEKALAKIGMSAESLRAMLSEKGLQATLLHLQEKFKANGMQMSEFFTKSGALKGVMGVLGESTESYVDILGQMQTSQGFVNKAFDETAETSAFKMEQALNSLKVAATDLGTMLFPVVEKIAAKIKALTNWWGGLDEAGKKNVLTWAKWVMIAGPALSIIGSMIIKGAALMKIFKSSIVLQKAVTAAQWLWNAALTANPIGVIIMAIAGLAGAFYWLLTSTSDTARLIKNAFIFMANGIIASINYIIKGINMINPFKQIPLIEQFAYIAKKELEEVGDEATNAADKIADLATGLDVTPTPTPDPDGGGDGDGDGGGGETEDEKATREAKEEALAASLERMRKLKQEFNVLTAKDEQAAALISLNNQETNALLAVEDTENAAAEKLQIEKNFAAKRKKLLADQTAETKKKLDEQETEWEKMFANISKGYRQISDVVNQVLGAIGGMLSAEADMENALLEEKHAKELEDYDIWMERETAKLENKVGNKAIEEQAMVELEKKAAEKKAKLEAKQEREAKALRIKAARSEKNMKIASAIMGTAQAVVNALGSAPPPFNFFLAGLVGALGAAQISMIASTPIPSMADGGLAMGETLAKVGDYAGAQSNPEVIAPLSKLTSLLGGGDGGAMDINITGELSGNDLILTEQQSAINRARFA
tara:strand:+ start:117 stop:2777 length:2661 start_codon:yes stop_codon:yes gene_type:complete